MKYQSGIQKDINGDIFILFGGSIGVSDLHTDEYDEKTCGIILQSVKEKFKVGATILGVNVTKASPAIILLFNNPESIDVIISRLQNIKKMMEE